MSRLPSRSVVVRAWFGEDIAWRRLVEAAETPSEEGFLANVEFIDDAAFNGLNSERLKELQLDRANVSFIADRTTLTDPEMPILAVLVNSFDWGVDDSKLLPFRVIPSELWSVENNIDLANMDWWDFSENVGSDGIFRGFPSSSW